MHQLETRILGNDKKSKYYNLSSAMKKACCGNFYQMKENEVYGFG